MRIGWFIVPPGDLRDAGRSTPPRCGPFYPRCTGDGSAAPARSLADAEAAEDLAEQVVRGEFAGDRRERALRLAQFLGVELERRMRRAQVLRGAREVRRRLAQRGQVAL